MSPDLDPAPFDLAEILSPGWLNAALQLRFPGLVVGSIREVETLASSAQKVRFVVTYTETAGHDVPTALCVKGYFNIDSARFGFSGVHEARFYGQLSPIVPILVPTARYAGIAADPPHGVVIMDDVVAAGGSFFNPLSCFDIETARLSLNGLADMHAQLWCDSLADQSYLAPKTRTYAGYITDEILNDLLHGPRGVGLPPEICHAGRLKSALFAVADRHTSRPRTLVHADADLGNLYRTADGRIGFADWQNYEFGHWSIDVAYHLATALEPAVLDAHEHDLLAHYLDRLAAKGGPAISIGEAWDDYCVAVAYGFFVWAMARRVDERVTVELTQRLGKAMVAHDTLDRLGV